MKNITSYSILFFVLALSGIANAQEIHNYQIISHALESSSVKDTYQIQVVLPINYKKIDNKEYDALYIFDSDVNFNGFVNSYLSLLKNGQVDTLILIVVGYGKYMMDNIYKRRRDFTFENSEEDPEMGGGIPFNQFIKTELFQFIQNKYSVSNNKIAFGHSLAGLYLVYDIYQTNSLFNASIISSNNAHFYIKHIEKVRLKKVKTKNSEKPVKVYASVGSDDEEGMLKSLPLLNTWNEKYQINFQFFKTELLDSMDHVTAVKTSFENGLIKVAVPK